MRKISIKTWEEVALNGTKSEASILGIITTLLYNKKPEELPRGLDKFRLYGRLAKIFDQAEKSKILELEEGDYGFLKTIIENDVLALWGLREETAEAIEDFLGAEKVEVKEKK